MTEHFFFFLGLSLILMHEIDGVRCKEWRIFPGLSSINDKLGYTLYLLVHLPLFLLLFFQLNQSKTVETFIFGFNIFTIVHIGLHLLFFKHPKNEFKDLLSWSLIVGAGIAGAIDLILSHGLF